MRRTKWLAARLERDPVRGNKTRLVIYLKQAHATDDEHSPIYARELTNEDMTSMVVELGIEVVDLEDERAVVQEKKAKDKT